MPLLCTKVHGVTEMILKSVESVGSAVLSSMVVGEAPSSLHTPTIALQLHKQRASQLTAGATFGVTALSGGVDATPGGRFEVPAGLGLAEMLGPEAEVSIQVGVMQGLA